MKNFQFPTFNFQLFSLLCTCKNKAFILSFMIERRISIGNIDPIDFYGINNAKFITLKEFFPKLKITARGDEIIIQGEESDIDVLVSKINALLEHYNKYNMLTIANLKRIILEDEIVEDPEDPASIIVFGNNGKIIRARTPNQRKLVDLARINDLLFATGPAGSGKTYTAIALAVKALRNKEVKRIILSRPAVEAGESLGFLPGDMKEKVDPYLQPLYDALSDMIPSKKLSEYLETEIIQIAPAPMSGFLLLHSLLTSVLPYICFTVALNYVEAGKVAILASGEPIAAMLFGIFFYQEIPTILSLIGLFTVLLALGLLTIPFTKLKKIFN